MSESTKEYNIVNGNRHVNKDVIEESSEDETCELLQQKLGSASQAGSISQPGFTSRPPLNSQLDSTSELGSSSQYANMEHESLLNCNSHIIGT